MTPVLKAAEETLRQQVFPRLDGLYQQVFERVLEGFQRHRVSATHFASVTGYGHDDTGREVTDAVFAHAMQAEDALVRVQIVSGTHAIAVALQGCLAPGDRLLSLTGQPYDTLETVLGLRGNHPRSLRRQGVSYEALALLGTADPTEDIRLAWTPEEEHAIQRATVGYIQRSRGYSLRPALTQEAMAALIAQAKALNPDLIVLVDNCYGEFTEAQEPTAYGADLMAGSLIKNPGGGIVPAGGYVAGRRALVEAAAEALTCPGVGRWGGYTFEQTRLLLQGLFLAPGVVHQTLQGMTLAAAVFDSQGKATFPHWQAPRADIIQVVALDTPEALLHFCRCIQAASPIDAFVRPEPAEVPGYGCPVVMAGGTFIEGATIELSADGPLRPPYTAFLQGGLSYAHVRYALRQWLETTVETETNTDKNISLGASFVYGGSNSINIMQRAF